MNRTRKTLLLSSTLAGALFINAAAHAATVTLHAVASTDQNAGDTGETFTSFSSFEVNNAGQIAFNGFTTPNGDGEIQGLFTDNGPGAAPVTVLFQGDASDNPAQDFVAFTNVGLNNNGQVVFRSQVHPPLSAGNTMGAFISDGPGLLTRAAFMGDPAGVVDGTLSGGFNSTINDAGVIAFAADVALNGGGSSRGLFTADGGGGVNLVAFNGDQAGDTGLTFTQVNAPAINNASLIAFKGVTTPDGSGNDAGIFVTTGEDGANRVVFEGDAVGATGLEFAAINGGSTFSFNNADQIAFTALTTPDAEGDQGGLFLADLAGNTSVVAFEGDAAGDSGQFFTAFFGNNAFALNDLGQTAFFAETTFDANANNAGIFLSDDDGSIWTVAFEGDEVIDALGVAQIIDTFSGAVAISTAGVAFQASFVGGGQGLFFAEFDNPSEVPVPAALPLMLAGLAGLRFASRRGKQNQ